jgi:hypothetical protein
VNTFLFRDDLKLAIGQFYDEESEALAKELLEAVQAAVYASPVSSVIQL